MRLKLKRKYVYIVFLLVIAIAVHYLTNEFNRPNNAPVKVGLAKVAAQPALNLTPFRYQSAYLSFNYPKIMQINKSSALVGPDIAKASLSYHDINSWDLEVDLTNGQGKAVTDNSDYLVRKLNPSVYQPSTININGQVVYIMTNTSSAGFSKTAFFQSGSRWASVSLVGDDPSGFSPLNTTFNMVLDSWNWR